MRRGLGLDALHLFLLLILASPLSARDADPDSAQETARRDDVAKLAPAKARRIEMLVGETEQKATLRAEPLLRWSNPTAGSVYGEVFLWTHQARPVAIASIYRWYHPFMDCTFEVVSTSPSSVLAREGDKTLWEAKGPSIAWKTLDAAPPPGKTASIRLNQMRQLARKFSAQLLDKRAGGEAVTRELRLLNQPVYRYESSEASVIDGGLFALVETTDPEVWVLLEAVQRDDKAFWQYALARMNADACEVRLDDKPVQAWEKIIEPWRISKAPYTLLGFKPEAVKIEDK
jgi:hypothetical protein